MVSCMTGGIIASTSKFRATTEKWKKSFFFTQVQRSLSYPSTLSFLHKRDEFLTPAFSRPLAATTHVSWHTLRNSGPSIAPFPDPKIKHRTPRSAVVLACHDKTNTSPQSCKNQSILIYFINISNQLTSTRFNLKTCL